MKENKIILLTAVFFLAVNTVYFWEPQLVIFDWLVLLVLFFCYIALVIIFFQQLFLLFKSHFNNRKKILITTGLLLVLITTALKPNGIIDFDRLSGKDLLIADREGVASCTAVLKFKDNHTFIKREYCFGTSEIKGSYEIKGDTILFTDVKFKFGNQYYSYAVIHQLKYKHKRYTSTLVFFRNNKDTLGPAFGVTKNELSALH